MFSPSYAMGNPAFNVGITVVKVLTADIIYHYPSMAKSFSRGRSTYHSKQSHTKQNKPMKTGCLKIKSAVDHHRALIEKLLDINRNLESRLSSLEDIQNETSRQDGLQKKRPAEITKEVPVKKRRRSKTKPLVDTRLECYTLTPRGWESTDRSKKSDSKQIIEFMKPFLSKGYVLNKKADNYKDQVKQVGDEAAAKLQSYLCENNISSTGSSPILKALRQHHFHGSCNDRIHSYRCLLAMEILSIQLLHITITHRFLRCRHMRISNKR
ncbi:hypothetical protein PHMEG_00017630 [Phytophthora megakarya]|uniref:Uncharacterized protein n=1 Tax=Phytophthora megakarya TaxID=4795 RepID=A0A225VXM0_9STRA|nr:hypothetical protein PHMEG_00017630 [Phytophthora megakarya]